MTLSYWGTVVDALFDSGKTVWVVPLDGAPEALRAHATTLERHLSGGEPLAFTRFGPLRRDKDA